MLCRGVVDSSFLIPGGIDRRSNLFIRCFHSLVAFLAIVMLFRESYACIDKKYGRLLEEKLVHRDSDELSKPAS